MPTAYRAHVSCLNRCENAGPKPDIVSLFALHKEQLNVRFTGIEKENEICKGI